MECVGEFKEWRLNSQVLDHQPAADLHFSFCYSTIILAILRSKYMFSVNHYIQYII